MTTHPAPDPFRFDPSRVVSGLVSWIHNRKLMVSMSYRMPDGTYFAHECEPMNAAMEHTAHLMRCNFDAKVSGLSAHQRMAWAAFVRQCQVEVGVAP